MYRIPERNVCNASIAFCIVFQQLGLLGSSPLIFAFFLWVFVRQKAFGHKCVHRWDQCQKVTPSACECFDMEGCLLIYNIHILGSVLALLLWPANFIFLHFEMRLWKNYSDTVSTPSGLSICIVYWFHLVFVWLWRLNKKIVYVLVCNTRRW